MPELAVILVNYKRPADTIECLQSLRAGSYQDYAAYVVDNASGDGSVESIRSACPDAIVVASDSNTGFCEGNNAALKMARSAGARYMMLLNNDTVADPRALEALVAVFRARPRMGVCGPKIYYHDKQNLLWFAGGSINLSTGKPTHAGIGEVDQHLYDTPRPCGFVTGCALTFRSEVYDRIGGLDPDYFAYFEDADFCTRAARGGFEVWYEPTSVIYHKVSSTAGWDSPVYLYFTLRNRLLFLRKNSSWRTVGPAVPALLFFFLRQFIRLIIKWRNFPGARAAWFGLVDGLSSSPAALGRGRLEQVKRSP